MEIELAPERVLANRRTE